jgi:hypothetical protein
MLKHLKDFKNFSLFETIRIEKMNPSTYEKETVTTLPYVDKIEENRQLFLKKLCKISEELDIKPEWLLHTIFHESRFDPKYRDQMSRAVGLISFLPSILKIFINDETGKTITPNDVLQMSNIDQLDLVSAFYKMWFEKMKLKSPIIAGDFAAITFYPAVIKKDWSWEFPDYVVDLNIEMFNKFPSGVGRTKKDYYDYIDLVLNNNTEQDDDNDYILGNFGGAFAEPGVYSNKKPLEFYKDLLFAIQDPAQNQELQAQDIENTEKSKQIGTLGINNVK